MRIKKITLYTNKLELEKSFYSKTIGLDLIKEDEQSFTVQAGLTELTFTASEKIHIYHYCFLIPSNKLEEALRWFERRVDIIEITNGQKIQHFESWNAKSFYFLDASGNLAECIVRHDLQNQSDHAFNQNNILCFNEIGFPTANIKAVNEKLSNILGSKFWKGDTERFGTHGDQEGLILLPNYEIKKKWFPTDIAINPESFNITIETDKEYQLEFLNDYIQLKE